MEPISNNPYREVGVLSNVSERALLRQKSRINAHLKVGKPVPSDYDFDFLQKLTRTENSIKAAFSKIEQNNDRVFHSMFWFMEANSFDKIALGYLKEGNIVKAKAIWEKVTYGKDISDTNFSCFSNLGTLKLLGHTELEIQEGIEAKIKLIESSCFKKYIQTVADETFTIDKSQQIKNFVDAIFDEFKGQYQPKEINALFENCNGIAWEYVVKRSTQEPISYLETKIESTKSKRAENRINAYEYGLRLHADCKQELTSLRTILGEQDLKYKMIADKLANEIIQCGVDYFNESQENDSTDNYLESAQELSKIANSIAVGQLAKDRAKDNLATLEDMKDSEINQAIAILNSVKLAYEEACSQIDAQVLEMRMTMSSNQIINYTKVDKKKANCLDWPKVVEVISKGISMKDVAAIQRCKNQSKVSEYKNLVDFLFGRLGPRQINKLKYLCYWKDVKTAQVKSTAKKIGISKTRVEDTSIGCFAMIARIIIGIIVASIFMAIIIGIISLFDQ